MLAKRIIPCLDVTGGRVVKGVNFVELRDAGDPVEIAARYNEQGADELTFLDITASSGDRATTYDVVSRTAESVFIPLTVGGGVRSAEDVNRLLRAGADKVAVNTAAIHRPELGLESLDDREHAVEPDRHHHRAAHVTGSTVTVPSNVIGTYLVYGPTIPALEYSACGQYSASSPFRCGKNLTFRQVPHW